MEVFANVFADYFMDVYGHTHLKTEKNQRK